MAPDPSPDRDPAAVDRDPAADHELATRAAVVLPALATAVAVAFAATGAGLLLPGAAIGDTAALGLRLGGVLLAVLGVLALVTRWGRGARVAGRDLASVLVAATVAMAGVTAATLLFSSATLTLPEPDPLEVTTTEQSGPTTTVDVATTTTRPAEENAAERGDRIDLLAVVAALLPRLLFAAVVALVVYALARVIGLTTAAPWRRGGPPASPAQAVPLDAGAADAALEASLDAVTAEASPRDAISDAYAQLLAALEEAGAGRRPQEAPHEHLDRVLTPLGVRSEPLHRLAELFVLARFSQHPVTAAHRDSATGALREALADLRAAEARRTGPARTPAPPGASTGAGR